MSHPLRLMICIALTAMLYSCKTTEKNMYDAYSRTVAARDSIEKADNTIYNAPRREMKHSTLVHGTDSVDVSTQWVRVTEDGGGTKESLRRYCVVVGQYKLKLNAVSMRARLAATGWPDAFVVETREPYYFVVVVSTVDIDTAIATLRRVENDKSLHMKAPLPFILHPSQLP